MEGNSTFTDLGGWIKHPINGFQNGRVTAGGIQTITFDVTFTSFSAVFGGASEKYIPLSVMEGMEVHLQLENVQNAIKYQYLNFPNDTVVGLVAIATNLGAHKTLGWYDTHHALVDPVALAGGFTAISNAAGDCTWLNAGLAFANTMGYYQVNISDGI